MEKELGASADADRATAAEPVVSALRDGSPSALGHDEAITAIVGCASVTILSYQEAIEGYLKLRGVAI